MDGSQQPSNSDGSWHFEPGETVSTRTDPAPEATETAETTETPATPVAPANPQPAQENWYSAEPADILEPRSVASPPLGASGEISWTASEFVAHHKSTSWYVILAVISVVAAALVRLLFKDTISAIMILIVGLSFGVLGARKPRDMVYRLDGYGLSIGPKRFSYQQFRSFAVVPEGAFASIVFMPLKRFAPLTTIYCDPSDEPKIIDLLSDRLPLEERQRDMIDRFMWHIRF